MATNYKLNINDTAPVSCGDNCDCVDSPDNDVEKDFAKLIADQIQSLIDDAENEKTEDLRNEMRETVKILAEAVADLSAAARLISELVDETFVSEA